MHNDLEPISQTRPGSEVYAQESTGHIHKRVHPRELENMNIIESRREILLEASPSIITPELIRVEEDMVVMTHVPIIKADMNSHFPSSDTVNSYIPILRTFTALRDVFLGEIADDQPDLDIDIAGTLGYLQNAAKEFGGKYRDCLDKVSTILTETQYATKRLKPVPAHTDPNSGNLQYDVQRDSVVMIDFENFGLRRWGYDAAKFYTYLCRNPDGQSLFKDKFFGEFGLIGDISVEEIAFFYRLASVRAFREICYIEQGHYDIRLGETFENVEDISAFRRATVNALSNTVDISHREIRSIIS